MRYNQQRGLMGRGFMRWEETQSEVYGKPGEEGASRWRVTMSLSAK